MKPMKKPLVIHPFLLAMFPILFLFAYNIGMVSASEILLASAVVLGFTSLSMLLLKMALGNGRKAGMVVSIFLVLFFSYSHLSLLIRCLVIVLVKGQVGANLSHTHLLLAWAVLFVLCVYMTIKSANLDKWTSILNIVAICLVATPLVRVGIYELRARRMNWSPSAAVAEYSKTNPLEEGSEGSPDIYYIILDRYASSSTLEEHFHFDNSEFTDHLTSRGFYIASEARANYPKTFQSLASSLNMRHLTYLTEELGRDTSDQTVVYQMLQDYEVWRFLKSRGYMFMHFGSWWEPTRYNRYADVNFTSQPAEFLKMLYRTTMLDPIGVKVGVPGRRQTKQRDSLRKFDKLAGVPDVEGPKFVFAHLLLPHEPYLFGPQGEMLTEEQVGARTEAENYLNQLAFVNAKIRWLIDQILSESARPPIIVLQADEGPFASLEEFEGSYGDTIDWEQLSDEALTSHMRIFSAYYLPDADYEDILYPSVTPVNSFRIIFDRYFGTNYALLEDKSYIFEDLRHPYSFIDVTDKVKYD
jgi:hypothetical protein